MQESQPAAVSGEAERPTSLRRRVRVAQTVGEIERLRQEVDAWKKRRDGADVRKRFVTQLQALHEVVTRALADLRTDTLAIGSDPDLGSVYRRCGLQDKRLLWVRRVLWGFYREKFDQRDGDDDNDLKKLLNAADDVVWSCYQEPFENLPRATLPGPIPLAYVEPFYSPQALPRNEVPGTLKDKRLGEHFLKEFFTRLPIPLVSLPPICVAAPWWLVYLSHEVGHHVQHDLHLVEAFETQLAEAATAPAVPAASRARAKCWAGWGQEIFADAFAVHMMGASVVHAIAELVTGPEQDMMIPQDEYPAPAIRLALLATLAGRLELDIDAQSIRSTVSRLLARSPDDEFGKELQADLRADLAMVDSIAAAVVPSPPGPLPDISPPVRAAGAPSAVAAGAAPAAVESWPAFRALSGWNDVDFRPAGALGTWTTALLNDERPAGRRLSAARHIVSASLEVWRQIAALTSDTRRATAMDTLRPRVLDAIDRTRDETTRDADRTAPADVGGLAGDISERLRHAELFEW